MGGQDFLRRDICLNRNSMPYRKVASYSCHKNIYQLRFTRTRGGT